MNYNFVKNTFSILLLLLIIVPSALAQDDPQRLDYSKTPRFYVIGKIETSKLENFYSDMLINSLNLVPGDSILIPGDQLSDTYRRLWNQQSVSKQPRYNFSDIKIETTFRGDTVDIMLVLKERLVVGSWHYEGVKSNELKDLKEKLKLRNGREYSEFLINTSLKLIKEYYDEKAYRFAKISHIVMPDTAQYSKPTSRIVVFTVDKGPKVRIGEIKFEGNKELTSKSLASSMKKTKKQTINFFQNSKLKDKEFPEDLIKVEEYMHSKGYRDGIVLADSIYKVDDKHIGIWINLEEGKKYYYRNITWVGNSVYDTPTLQQLIQMEKGDIYDSETLESRLGTRRKASPMERSIATMYKDEGYLDFNIEPIETVVGDSVDVQIRVIENRPFRISDVSFQGNTRTNDHVIRRELDTVPGEMYSQSLLMRSYQRLASMGQFDQASINPVPEPNYQDQTVEIKYTFKEVSNDQLELSGGWGGGMFIASVGLNFTNVAIRKVFEPGAWRPYPSGDNQQLSLKLQSNGTYYQAFSISFTEPWLGGRKPNNLNVAFYSSRESNAYMLGQLASKFFTTTGGSVSLGKRLRWPDPYFTMSVGLSLQSYKMQDWDWFLFKNGHSSTVALNLNIARNSIDDPYQYPSMGSNMSLAIAVTPPFSSFDNHDYTSTTLSEQDRYRWVEYHKWKLNAQWFFPLTIDRKLVIMARAQYGYLGYYNQNKTSPFEGFTMGGDGLTGYSTYGAETIGLRGYQNNSLTPEAGGSGGKYANIYSKYTAEIRYPFVKEGSTLVYGLAFLEAGNAYTSLKDFNPFNLKRSAGVGVRIFLPIVGMLGVDWGYGFDVPAPGASSGRKGEIHFTMGMQL